MTLPKVSRLGGVKEDVRTRVRGGQLRPIDEAGEDRLGQLSLQEATSRPLPHDQHPVADPPGLELLQHLRSLRTPFSQNSRATKAMTTSSSPIPSPRRHSRLRCEGEKRSSSTPRAQMRAGAFKPRARSASSIDWVGNVDQIHPVVEATLKAPGDRLEPVPALQETKVAGEVRVKGPHDRLGVLACPVDGLRRSAVGAGDVDDLGVEALERPTCLSIESMCVAVTVLSKTSSGRAGTG